MQQPLNRAEDGEWVRRLHASPFCVFGQLHAPRVWLLRRSSARYADIAAVEHEIAALTAAFPTQPLPGLHVDMRRAPPTNDPAFEHAMQGLRDHVARRAARVVLLVQTASGAMQIARFQRAESTRFYIARELDEALRWLEG